MNAQLDRELEIKVQPVSSSASLHEAPGRPRAVKRRVSWD